MFFQKPSFFAAKKWVQISNEENLFTENYKIILCN